MKPFNLAEMNAQNLIHNVRLYPENLPKEVVFKLLNLLESKLEAPADTQLRDAAPELLAALITLADRNVTYWSEDGEARSNFGSQQKAMAAFRLARAAIAKATGDSE